MYDHAAHKKDAPTFDKAFIFSIVANGLFVLFQVVFAYIANSSGLLADAIHNLGDVVGLVLAFIASRLSVRSPSMNKTYGLKKTSILAALANGLFLVFSSGMIVMEATYKFFYPSPVMALPVMIVASLGIVVNGVTALMFISGKEDLNIRAAFWHLLSDALVSVAVVISAALLYWTGKLWLDPLVGIMIAAVILKSTWSVLADSIRLILDCVPRHISLPQVRELLLNEKGVSGVHDLHIWALSTNENALSVHLWMPDMPLTDERRQSISRRLKEEHRIQHITVQVERLAQFCEDAC